MYFFGYCFIKLGFNFSCRMFFLLGGKWLEMEEVVMIGFNEYCELKGGIFFFGFL